MAAMLALQSPAGTRYTDKAFNEGQRRKMERMHPDNARAIHARARAAGINPDGKYYVGALGKHTDPAAWVSSADDVLAVCKARNLDCDGVIRHKAVEKEVAPPPDVPLAPDLVQQFEKKYLAADPGLAEKVKKNPKARHELREKIVERHGRPKRKKLKTRL